MADIFSSLTDAFSNPTQDNYYAKKAKAIYDPARERAISTLGADKIEAEQQAIQRNQMQGIGGTLAEANIQRNARLINEAGGRNLNTIDEQARQSMYAAAEKDKTDYENKKIAQQQGIFDAFKMGAGLLTGGWKGISNMFKPVPEDLSIPKYEDYFAQDTFSASQPDIQE